MDYEKTNEIHQNQTEKDIVFFEKLINEVVLLTASYVALETLKDGIFEFSKYNVLRKKINHLFDNFRKKTTEKINFYVGKHYNISASKSIIYKEKEFVFENRKKYIEKFKNRPERLLSERVWNISGQLKTQLEMALDLAISEGVSAQNLASELKKYLKNPDTLFRKYRDKNGNLQLSKKAKEFHSGQGVYRSAYKNAERLARTEINIAYRTADIDRWQTLDFVSGYEIKRSKHPFPCKICDMMAGQYPKSFLWVGNHPNCRCYMVPIFKKEVQNVEINPKLTEFMAENPAILDKKPMFLWNFGKENDKLSRYKDIPFKELEIKGSGKLEIFTKGKQNGQEESKNTNVLHFLAERGYQYRLLPVIEDGNKNPDAFNLVTQKFTDIKVTESTNGKSIIQNTLKEASKQGVSEAIIQFTKELQSNRETFDTLKAVFKQKRAKNIEKILFIMFDKRILEVETKRFK